MANAWMLRPLVPTGLATIGTVTTGQVDYAFNDYAGVVFEMLCDSGAGGMTGSVRLDLGVNTAFDTVMVFGVSRIPSTSSFNVNWATSQQGNFTGAFSTGTPTSVYAATIIPASGVGVTLWSLPSVVGARYLSLDYTALTAGRYLRISRVVVGRRVQLARNFSYGANLGVRDLGSLDFSPRGVLQRRRGAKLRTAALTFSSVYQDELETTTKPLLELIGNTDMLGLVLDPDADAQRINRCYFGPLVGDLGHTRRNAVAWETKVNLVSIF